MATKHITDHRDGDEHTRQIVEKNDEDQVTRITEQRVADTPLGELGASNTKVTEFDSEGNSRTTRK